MNARVCSRSRTQIVIIGMSVGFIAIALILLSTARTIRTQAVAAPLSGTTYVVNSTLDEPDADPSNGVCSSTPSAKCTLRAAIMESNFVTGPNTITLPAGTYVLTRTGYDDNALVGDLDIAHDLTIQGAGSGVAIVDGNGGVTNDRVFHILSTAFTVNMSGMTIRNGKATTNSTLRGGGIFHDGANCGCNSLLLSDLVIEGNTADPGGGGGGGLYAQNDNLTLINVLIEGNTADDGGGLYATGALVTVTHSTIHANTAMNQGGGVWGDSIVPVMRDSKVYSNTAANQGGGFALTTILLAEFTRLEIYSNTSDFGGGLSINSFYAAQLVDSYLHDNHATTSGGAIYSHGFPSLVLSRTVLDANSAGIYGGGIMITQTGSSSPMPIMESTLSHNTAQYGGGMYDDGTNGNRSPLILLNSTLSDNSVSHDGGGIYAIGDAQIFLFNATIAGNVVTKQTGQTQSLRGGGLFITTTAIITAQNTLIADNVRAIGLNPPVPDDCFVSPTTSLHSLGYNLVETTTNCIFSGTTFGNITGQDSQLGLLWHNGGLTPTRALRPDSPAIDAGNPSGCTDNHGATLTTDQRGFIRPYPTGGLCDIGAFEFYPHVFFLPLIQR